MIKIVKAGTKRVEQCELCGCIFSFDDEDITSDWEESTMTVDAIPLQVYTEKITCPQCSSIIILKSSKSRSLEEATE